MSLHTLKKTFSRGQQKFSMAGNQITYISLWALNPACYQEARGISDDPIVRKVIYIAIQEASKSGVYR